MSRFSNKLSDGIARRELDESIQLLKPHDLAPIIESLDKVLSLDYSGCHHPQPIIGPEQFISHRFYFRANPS